MSDCNLANAERVLGRSGARVLSRQEVEQVTGGRNQTFAFTHVITDDVIHD